MTRRRTAHEVVTEIHKRRFATAVRANQAAYTAELDGNVLEQRGWPNGDA
jgi:hypothetical protein